MESSFLSAKGCRECFVDFGAICFRKLRISTTVSWLAVREQQKMLKFMSFRYKDFGKHCPTYHFYLSSCQNIKFIVICLEMGQAEAVFKGSENAAHNLVEDSAAHI